MKRKLLSLILVVAMLASVAVFTPAASAAESKATLAFGNAVGVAGDEVTVDFTVTTDALQGLQFMLEYDTSRLTLDGVTYSDDYDGMGKELTEGAAFTPFTAVGPYRVFSWAEINGNVLDLSEGVVLATLNFTINEDAPAGDAYVKFAPLAEGVYQPNKLMAEGGVAILKDEMTFVDGAVTVLPAGYASSATVADEDWDFENGVIFGCLDDSLVDYTGAIVIPSEINGDAVVEIGDLAFNGYACSTMVIPASVTYLGAGAVYNCENLTTLYILGEDVEFANAAVGYGGGTRNGAPRNPSIILNDSDEVLTSIYGVAGSTVEDYAVAGDGLDSFPFYAEVPYTMSFNGASYLVSAETKIPGSAVIDGKTVIAWTDGENTYVPGADVTLTESVVLEPVTITAPTTTVGADIKLAAAEADLAMRFTASLSKADYATLAELGDVTLGMLITPAKRVAQAGSFTKEALDALEVTHKYVDIAINGYYKETADDYILAGSLKGFSATTLAKNPDFAAVVYATVETADGTTFTVYGDFNFNANQNVKTVATDALAADLTNTQKGWLNNLIGKFTK